MSIWIAITYIISTMLLALVSPFLGFLGLACSILIRFQDRFEIIAQHPTFLYMAVACCIGFYIHRDKLGKADFWPDKYWRWFLIWVFLGLLIMAPTTLISELKFLISSIIMYYFASRSMTSENKFILFFIATIGVSAAMGYEALSSFLTDPDSPFNYTVVGQDPRMIGLGRYANANEFGALMVIPMGFVLSLVLLSRSILFKLIYLAIGALLIYATALTFSRTCLAIVGIMAMVVAALWGKGNVIKRVVTYGIVGFGLLSVLTVMPGPLQSRIMSILDYNEDASFQGRQRAWDQGFIMVRYQPIFGVGMSQWPYYHGKAPHNSFVQAMAETGLPGIFFYLAALFFSVKTNLRIIEIPPEDPRYNKRNRILAICITATLIGYMVYAFFGNQAYTPFMYLYSGICAALANLVKLNQKEPKTLTTNEPKQKTSAQRRRQRALIEQDPLQRPSVSKTSKKETRGTSMARIPAVNPMTSNTSTSKKRKKTRGKFFESTSTSDSVEQTPIQSNQTDQNNKNTPVKKQPRFPQAPM